MWLLLLYFWSLLSQFLCLLPLVSPYFLLFHAILEPQNSPPSEVTGYMAVKKKKYIYIYIYIGHCPSTVLGVDDHETVLETNPNPTADQSKPYLETIETIFNLYSDKICFLSLTVGLTRKCHWKLARFRFQTVRDTVLGQRLITILVWPPLQTLAVIFWFVASFGWWKMLWEVPVKILLSGKQERVLELFGNVLDSVSNLFRGFQRIPDPPILFFFRFPCYFCFPIFLVFVGVLFLGVDQPSHRKIGQVYELCSGARV